MVNDQNKVELPAFSFYERGFQNYSGKIVPRNKTNYRPVNIVEIYNYISTNKDAECATMQLRKITDEKESKDFKILNFRAFTPAGVFSPTRNSKNLVTHSGLMVIDFDHLGDEVQIEQVRNILLEDPEFDTALLFVSPRGHGLKWIIYIGQADAGSHSQLFSIVCNYLKKKYGLEADKSGSDVSRLCFLPFDPNCYINPEFKQIYENPRF